MLEHVGTIFGIGGAVLSGHPERDVLIEKYERDELTWSELQKFVTMLREIEGDMSGPRGERLAAGLVLAEINRRYAGAETARTQ